MKRLGISVYSEYSKIEEIEEYIKLGNKYGFTRLFSCLISVEDKKDIEKMKEINEFAKNMGFEVIVDVSPAVFERLGIDLKDLSVFKDIGADGIRLDIGYTGKEETLMTYNEYGLKIELNMSQDTHYIDTIMDYRPNRNKIIGCHNFYPHKNTGLTVEHLIRSTDKFTKYGVNTASFITSQAKNTFGAWPVTDGVPTLEMHRALPIEVQVKHYIALDNIDDLIIANCYATEEEMMKISNIRHDLVSFEIILEENVPEIERKILYDELHYNRGDISKSLIRSTQSRVKYKGHDFKLFNPKQDIKKGDVLIESSEYGHYAGELQIAKENMKNSGKTNVVARIREEELFLIDCIKPWQKFVFITSN